MMPFKKGIASIQAWTTSATFDNTVQKWTGRLKGLLLGICLVVILLGVSYIIISPIIGVLSKAFMSSVDLANPLIFLIPQNFTFENMMYALRHMNYVRTLITTLIYALSFALIHVFIASMVGYGFARFRFKGSGLLFGLVILTIVVPVQSYMVPLFINFRYFLGQPDWNMIRIVSIGGVDMPFSWSVLLLSLGGVGLRSGLYIYIFRQFFRGLPKEIEEAAFVDGASPLYTYAKVMIPNAVPAIVTVFLFAFVWHYNDTFYASLLMHGNRFMSSMLLGLGPTFNMQEDVDNPLVTELVVFAGVLLTITPILTIYLILQRYFIEGLERSGIVG